MVYKRGRNYSYKFKWTVKGAEGTRDNYVIRQSARTGNMRKAKETEEEHRRALRLGQIHPRDPWPQPPPPQAPPFRDFAVRFQHFVDSDTKPRTAGFYKECLNRALAYSPLADAVLTAITSEVIGKYAAWRSSQPAGNSVASINAELQTLRRLFRLAEEWKVVNKAPAIHELQGQKGRERVVSFEEEARYLQVASPNVQDMAILAVDTGLRPNSELFPIQWVDINLEPSPRAPYGVLHVPSGKTDSAVRNIPLSPRAWKVLQMRKARDGASRFVFPGASRTGHITSVQHAHERATKRAGVEPFAFYCWRTRCAESGMDKFTLARLMGHSSPRVAERYYVHVTEPHVSAGFDRFLEYQASKLIDAFPAVTEKVQ